MKNKAVYIIAGPNGSGKTTFARGINNFFGLYEPLFDSLMLFDNSKAKPILIAKRRNGHREVLNDGLFKIVQRSAR